MRTPTTNIKVAGQMLELVLQRYNLDEPRIDRYLKVLQTECQQEINLINDLLDLQQLEAGTRSLNFIEVNLHNWLPRVVHPFQDRIREGDRTLVLDIADPVPLLTTDVASLHRILSELLYNACAYTPPGETIELTVEAVFTEPSSPVLLSENQAMPRSRADAIILLSLCSTGVELSPEEQSRVFDKFYRLIGIDRWRYRGTGLSMALVKRLTEHIGGTVELTSDQNQICFLIELPVAPPQHNRRSPQRLPIAPPDAGSSPSDPDLPPSAEGEDAVDSP
jgi:signal transduction histidine kinase